MINSAIRKRPFAVSDERAFCFELLGVLHRARFANDVDANLTIFLKDFPEVFPIAETGSFCYFSHGIFPFFQ